jgi:hypothetical protein
MSIDRSEATGCLDIVVGDGDVLIGMREIGRSGVMIWVAPLPANHGLPLNEVVSALTPVAGGVYTSPPEDTVLQMYFLNQQALESFVDTLEMLGRKVWG